uniref:Uncharacterized protein n=1 Tax=Anopheles melas TaxID=34690 RepID=A0A182UHT9_9DIPT
MGRQIVLRSSAPHSFADRSSSQKSVAKYSRPSNGIDRSVKPGICFAHPITPTSSLSYISLSTLSISCASPPIAIRSRPESAAAAVAPPPPPPPGEWLLLLLADDDDDDEDDEYDELDAWPPLRSSPTLIMPSPPVPPIESGSGSNEDNTSRILMSSSVWAVYCWFD